MFNVHGNPPASVYAMKMSFYLQLAVVANEGEVVVVADGPVVVL